MQESIGKSGNRPLHLAAAGGHLKILKCLLEAGASLVHPPGLNKSNKRTVLLIILFPNMHKVLYPTYRQVGCTMLFIIIIALLDGGSTFETLFNFPC